MNIRKVSVRKGKQVVERDVVGIFDRKYYVVWVGGHPYCAESFPDFHLEFGVASGGYYCLCFMCKNRVGFADRAAMIELCAGYNNDAPFLHGGCEGEFLERYTNRILIPPLSNRGVTFSDVAK